MRRRVLVDVTAIGAKPSGVRTRVVNLFSTYVSRFDDPEPLMVVTDVSGLGGELSAAGVATLEVHGKPSRATRMFNNSRTWSQRLRESGASALHLETPPVPRRIEVPILLELHDLRFFEEYSRGVEARGIYQRHFLRSAVRRVDKVITPTEYGASVITTHLRIGRDRIRVVPGAAAVPNASPSPADIELIRRKYGLDGPIVLAVGHVERRKNLGCLIEAVRLLDAAAGRHHPVVVVGDDHGSADELRRQAGRWPPVWLTLTGVLSEPEKWASIAAASCLVIPSLIEGFGIVAVEAMSLGCPVLAARAAALPEVVGTGGLLFDPLDASELSRCLEAVLGDPRVRERLAQAALDRAHHFTWAAGAEALHAAYAEVVP